MANRPSQFQNFGRAAPSADNATQPIGSSLGNSRWPSNDIWGNRAFGGSRGPNRESSSSRGSDDMSPTGPSGSAQLNPLSEAVPWASRGQIWNSSATTSHRPSASGSASPTRIREIQEITNNSHVFSGRAPLGQNGTTFPGRQRPAGNVEATTSSKYPGYGEAVGDVTENPGLYGAISAPSGIYRRNSSDSTFASFATTRQDSIASRQPETEPHLASTHFSDNSHYAVNQNTSNHTFHTQRPSVPSHSMSFPAEGANRSRLTTFGPNVTDKDFDDSFNRALNLGDTPEPDMNGYTTNGFPNPVSQPFQYNPGSSSWLHEPSSSSRGYGVQDTYADSIPATHLPPKRGSVGGGSPAGHVFRPSLNSPRTFGNTPNQRAESWNKPNLRDLRIPHDIDRQSQYLPQQIPPYFASQLYNANLSQYTNPYEQYAPNSQMRSGVPLYPYAPPIQVPFRPSKDQDPGKGIRSMVLEDFRGNNKSKRFELKDIFGHVVEFSGDQHGSRFIQEKLQTANSDEKEQVFREVEPNAIQLMKDVFGNYVIQKFFEHGNQVQKKILASMMKGKVAELSTQMYACRVVQKALEHVLVEQQAEIVEELKQKIMQVVRDQNGNHVVQKIIEMFPNQCMPAIMDAFRGQVGQLAGHTYVCRVIQRMLEHGTDAQKRELMEEIHGNAAVLVIDQFGNYVAQHVIEFGDLEDRSKMIQLVMTKLVGYSKHKFASNVVEKCIKFGTPEQRKGMHALLTAPSGDGTSELQHTIKDPFGNYVIQSMLHFLEGPERESFIREVTTQCAQLRRWGGGGSAKQIAAIDRLLAQATQAQLDNGTGSRPTVTTTTPSSPGLQGNLTSTAPTPPLTTRQSSPQSSGPPSTDAGPSEDPVADKGGSSLDGQPNSVVHVNEQ
ncbi:hypothetical protein DL769_000405 [Monosporascus sp. CRB-8-3]|nr:hypothetical protein DL769_000405 [Monosporascus sp. CRB-8-3]